LMAPIAAALPMLTAIAIIAGGMYLAVKGVIQL